MHMKNYLWQKPAWGESMKIQIVIVNYRTPELTIDCLQSLVDNAVLTEGVRVTLVDNYSCDDSVAILSQAIEQNGWQEWIDWMPIDTNGGYAHGNNVAIRAGLGSNDPPDYVWLLNPDTVVHQGGLQHLVDFLEANPNVGIAGSRLEDPDTTPQRSAFRFPTFWSEVDDGLRLGLVSRFLRRFVVAPPVPKKQRRADWVAGASMLVRREVFEQVGLLDEDYFMYYEEVDFCRQASLAGWDCWYVPSSRVVHLVGQASGVTNKQIVPKRRPKYWFDSRRRYFVKNHGAVYAMIADVSWASCYSIWCVRSKLQRKSNNDPPKYLVDFVRNSVFFQGFGS